MGMMNEMMIQTESPFSGPEYRGFGPAGQTIGDRCYRKFLVKRLFDDARIQGFRNPEK
jgi:hypothetical protein